MTGRARCRIGAATAVLLGLLGCGGPPDDFPTVTLALGSFPVTQTEGGEIRAASGEQISSPRIGGRLKIVYLFPEGDQVDIGQLVLAFDPAEFEREMLDREGRLEQAQAELARATAEMNQTMADVKRQIEQRQAELQLARLSAQRAEFSSPIDLQRAKIQTEKAERALAEGRSDSVAQEVVNRVDLSKYQFEIDEQERRYSRAKADFERTSIFAARPGIVVYRKIWKPGTDGESKVTVGDQVWGGQPLLDIPDLSKMEVLCLVGEVDVKRMDPGQSVFIRMEAFPGPVWHGKVARLAPMATPQPGAPTVHVFEVIIDIDEQDPRLKPGMSAEVEVVVETVPDVLSLPLDAIFPVGGRQVAYRRHGRGFEPVSVKLGHQSATAAVIDSGLAVGDVVALRDPTVLK
ncbi:MAG: efflux RND transporter periplasmic adaptor subunit [Candidatus Latescibacterota bacterium]|jgi:HlyD family secretion protein